MKSLALALALVLGITLAPRSALAHHGGVHGQPRFHGQFHRSPVVVFAPARPFVARPFAARPFVAPFRVHPHGFRHFGFGPVAPRSVAVFVGPFWFWNGFSWIWVPGHWSW